MEKMKVLEKSQIPDVLPQINYKKTESYVLFFAIFWHKKSIFTVTFNLVVSAYILT